MTYKHKALAIAIWMLLLAFLCGFLIRSAYSPFVAIGLVVCAIMDAFVAGMWFGKWSRM